MLQTIPTLSRPLRNASMETALGAILIFVIVAAFVVAIFRPWLAFVMVICWPILEQALQSYFLIFVTIRPLFNFMIAGLVAVSVLGRFLRRPELFQGAFNPVAKFTLAFCVLSLISIMWSPDFENGWFLSASMVPYKLLYLLLAPLLISTLEEFRATRIPMIAIGSAALLIFLLGPTAELEGTRLMLKYSAGEKGNAGAIGDLGTIVMLFSVLTLRQGTGKLLLPLQMVAGVFGFGMGLLSGARGQVLLSAAMAFLYYPMARKVKNIGGFIGMGMGIGILVLVVVIAIRLFVTADNLDRWSADSLSDGVLERYSLVEDALTAWVSNPINYVFGRGAGAFILTRPAHAYPHNHPVEALTELGIVGFALYLGALIYTCRAAIGLFKIAKDREDVRSSAAIMIALASFYFMLSLKQGTIHNPSGIMVWFLVLAHVYWHEKAVLEDTELDDEYDDELDDDEYEEAIEDDEDEYAPSLN